MNKHKQQGVAMLLAMTVMAFMTIMATSLLFTQQINVRRTANILHGDQAHQFTLAVERLGTILLQRDKQNGKVDHLGEPWANFGLGVAAIQSEMAEHITLSGTIEDLQGKYNLNNLVDIKGKVSKEDVKMFQRLLRALDLNENIASAVVDWIDSDANMTIPEGAEDGEYLGLERPYRAANQLLLSPTELYLVKGINQEVYKKLYPYISVLKKRTKINVNTASAQVLAMLTDNLSLADAEEIVKEREENFPDGFANLNDFAKLPTIANLTKTNKKLLGDLKQNFTIDSDYFMIASTAHFGEGYMQMFSIIVRNNKQTRVIHRGQGGF